MNNKDRNYNHNERYALRHFIRERFIIPARISVYKLLRGALLIFVIALLSNFIFSYFFYTPKMWNLREQNNELVLKHEMLLEKIKTSKRLIDDIRYRDNNVYRSIFSADTTDYSMADIIMNQEMAENSELGRYSPLISESSALLDALSVQLYISSQALDELEILAIDKDAMSEAVPAIWPVDRNQVRGSIGAFGRRVHPIYRSIRMHEGIDFAGKIGTPIYATGNGIVVKPKNESGYGRQIMIDHGFGYKTRYAHLNSISVKPGDYVKRGQKIGELGNSGRSTGPHLHYEVILRGKPVNPINYISRDMSQDEFRKIIKNAKSITYEID